jgi:hypothetical protein
MFGYMRTKPLRIYAKCANIGTMAKTRALMTQTERERIARREDIEEIKRYQAISRVRARVKDELIKDVDVLRQHHPDLLEELREVVCEPRHAVEPEGQLPSGAREEVTRGGSDLPEEDEISDAVWRVVDEVSRDWDDDARLENRRKAAATALQYALDHDVHLGRSTDVVPAIRERYPVEGQNEETWWRKNVRDVLKEVGEYSRGQHGYAVENLEGYDE